MNQPDLPPRDTRSLLRETDIATIISPLAEEIQILLDQIAAEQVSDDSNNSTEQDDMQSEGDIVEESGGHIEEDKSERDSFSAAFLELLYRSEMLFQYSHGFSTMVLRVTDSI